VTKKGTNVTEENASPNTLPAYSEARSVLDPLLSATQLLGLLLGAHHSGLLAAARTPSSSAQLAAVTGIDESRVIDICRAFDAHGVLIQTEGRYRLADPWLVLTSPDSPKRFEDILMFTFTQMKILANATAGDEDYWTLTSEDRLAMAIGFSTNPFSSQAPAIAQAASQEVHDTLIAGGHCLELGCGVSGMLFSRLRAYPKLTGVGVDRAPDLLAVARQRAAEIGVAERVQFFESDVSDFNAPAQFDVVFWSQPFFPAASRAAALRVSFQSLMPGGILITRLLPWEPSILIDNLHTDAGKAYSLFQVINCSWGIPIVDMETLLQEITDAGFLEVKLAHPTPSRRDIVARRPV
jgi:predicted O-methyltransferase YrrM